MAIIVLVHGIGQEQLSADSLEKDWLPALAGGVRTAGYPDLADRIWRSHTGPGAIETRMAFYGNLFLRPDQQGTEAEELSDANAQLAEQLAEEWLERAATQASHQKTKQTAVRELAYVRHQIGKEEAGGGAAARLAINSLARLRWFAVPGMAFAERFVKSALTQVTQYLTDENIRAAAQRAVLDLIDADTRVVVAHSLGSIVAYEAMHRLERPLPLFCTLGSPLGLQTIVYQRLRPQPPTFPKQVKRWVNLADRDDFIAAEPDLVSMFSQGFAEGSLFEGGYTVDNGAEPHRAEFYLSKKRLGWAIAEALNT
jgi:fructose-specific component phosphotransferase system IIB-like protein